MVYCYKCGLENPTGSIYCNKCGSTVTGEHSFEDKVKSFADEMVKVGKDLGEKAAEMAKKAASEAKSFSEEVAKKVNPKPLPCPNCKTTIFETDAFCYHCGGKTGW